MRGFRNHLYQALTAIPDQGCIIAGDNGAGKTNLLEAVSMLYPGRGLRSAPHLSQLRHPDHQHEQAEWSVRAALNHHSIAAAWRASDRKRRIHIDDTPVVTQAQILHVFRCLWLTPEKEGLIADNELTRRRFIDQIIISLDNKHAVRVRNLHQLLQSRLRLLGANGHRAWLDTVEQQLVPYASSVLAARARLIEALTKLFEQQIPQVVPIRLRIAFDLLQPPLSIDSHADAIENAMLSSLKNNRPIDQQRRKTTASPERFGLIVEVHDGDGQFISAHLASTGQRKAALLSLITAAASHIWLETNAMPLLLLDDAASHLDQQHRLNLLACVSTLQAQTFFTGTDPQLYQPLLNDMIVLKLA